MFQFFSVMGALFLILIPSATFAQQNLSARGVTLPNTTGFSGVPGTPSGGPDLQRSRFTYQLQPSQSVKDYFYVSNVGTTPIDVFVYAADAKTTSNGSYELGSIDQPSVAVGSWVTFANHQSSFELRLKRGQSSTVPFTLKAPIDASPGDHAGGMVVTTRATGGGQVNIEQRVATRLYARIQGDLTPNLTISNFSSHYTPAFNPLDGTVTESFTISNTGNVSLKGIIDSRVSGFLGLPLAPDAAAELSEILPGTSRDFTISVTGVGQWVFYNSSIVLKPSVDADALNPGALTTLTRDSNTFEFPTTWFILLVILLVIIFVVRSSLARRRRQVRQWLEYTAAEAARKAERE